MTTPLTDQERAEMKRLAEKATPGPWEFTGNDIWYAVGEQVCCGNFQMGDRPEDEPSCCNQPDVNWTQTQIGSAGLDDVAFIAAANPTAVLSLLAENELLRGKQRTVAEANACAEILDIMRTYDEQDAAGSVDTPGGLEHMGDVWKLLDGWRKAIRAAQLGEK